MPPPADPAHLDRYDLDRVHSEGGLGRVWLAHDPRIGRVVALKELLAEQAARPEARARFLSEARITGQLEHPNIVPVYEVGERGDDGRPYYAMRFVDGPTLADAIRDEFERFGHRWPRNQRQGMVRALCSVCHAIAHAHERGVVHRDLKPENIILGAHGELLLLDWGLAKRLGEPDDALGFAATSAPSATPQTQAGSVMGTIAYMAPEQAAGLPADVRTDVYGLGAILFEILTGRPPHVGDDPVAVLARIVDGDSPRAGDTAPGVPAALDAVCRSAMAKDLAARYADAGVLLADLEAWLADDAVSVLPDGPWSRATRWVRRHQAWAYAGALTLLVLALVATGAAFLLGASADRERSLREQGLVAAARLGARAVAIEIDLRWSVLESAAAEPELAEWLMATGGDDARLQQWIETRFSTQASRTLATSWIVMDRSGIQRARAPFGGSVGRSYAFRDYFHGQGRDLPRTASGVEPIRSAHRSIVFRSHVTRRMMVAFSVPVHAPEDPEDVVGVLGMTVELGRFAVLDLGVGPSQVTALIDTRDDWRERDGLVLQHAELVRVRRGMERETGRLPSYYLPAELVTLCRALAAESLRGADPVTSPLDRSYRDPVGGSYGGRWLAAFAPVLVGDRDTGWVVIAQERLGFD